MRGQRYLDGFRCRWPSGDREPSHGQRRGRHYVGPWTWLVLRRLLEWGHLRVPDECPEAFQEAAGCFGRAEDSQPCGRRESSSSVRTRGAREGAARLEDVR